MQGTSNSSPARHLAALVTSVFNCWRASGVEFLVLRNYEGLPDDTSNDIDVLVSPKQLDLAERLLVAAAKQSGYLLHNRAEFLPVSLFFHHPESLQQIQFDLFWRLRWQVFDLLSLEAFLARRIERGLFAVPHPAHEAANNLFGRFIYTGKVKEKFKPAIEAAFNEYAHEATLQLTEHFGDSCARRLVAAVQSGRWPDVERMAGEVHRQLIWRHLTRRPLQTMAAIFSDFRRLLRRIVHPSGINVVLIGPDGCGKSAAADGLSEALRGSFSAEKTLRVHWKPVVFLRNRRQNRPPTTNPHGRPPRNRFASIAVLLCHWLEYLAGWCIQFFPVLFRNGPVIVDRFHYDFVVDPRRFRLDVPAGFARNLFRLLPSPDLVFLLDAPPEVLQSRKREVPLTETARQRDAYLALARTLPNAVVVDATQPLSVVINRITKETLNYMRERRLRRANETALSTRFQTSPLT